MPKAKESLIQELEQVASKELGSIDEYLAGLDIDKNLLVMEVIRYVDRMAVANWLAKDDGGLESEFAKLLILYGYTHALGMLLPKVETSFGMPLLPSSPERREHASALLNHTGRVRLLQRYLLLARSGVLNITRKKSEIKIVRTDQAHGVEVLESLEKGRIQKLWEGYSGEREEGPDQIPSDLTNWMRDNVYVWRNEFIGYDADPDVDLFFLEAAMKQVDEFKKLSGIYPNFKFGAVSGTHLLAVAAALISIHMKHIGFCLEYIQKYPNKDLSNVITIWDEKQKLIEAVSEILDLPRVLVHRSLNLMALNKQNVAFHSAFFTPSYPALIEVNRRMWMRPVSSVFGNTLLFTANELKRAHGKSWDKSIRKREAWFRDDLYALFMGNRYEQMPEEKPLQEDGETLTDVDAAILDREYGTLALFELKWQEPIGDDEPKRRSRAKRLGGEFKKWVGATTEYFEKYGVKELARQLGFDGREASSIRSAKLFFITRHNARFSGFNIEHPDCVTASWQQFTRVRLEKGAVDDTFSELFAELKKEECRELRGKPTSVRFTLSGLDIEAEQFVSFED